MADRSGQPFSECPLIGAMGDRQQLDFASMMNVQMGALEYFSARYYAPMQEQTLELIYRAASHYERR